MRFSSILGMRNDDAVVASLGVEPRWASPVDFESTASTSSATRPSEAALLAAVGARQFRQHSPARDGYDTAIRYEILSRLRSAGGAARARRATTCRVPCAAPAARFITRIRASWSWLRARMAGPHPAVPARHRAAPRLSGPRRPAFLRSARRCRAPRRASRSRRRGPRVQIGSLLAITHVLHAAQVHMIFRARMLEAASACGEESLQVGLYEERDIPWERDRLPEHRLCAALLFRGSARRRARRCISARYQPPAAAAAHELMRAARRFKLCTPLADMDRVYTNSAPSADREAEPQ